MRAIFFHVFFSSCPFFRNPPQRLSPPRTSSYPFLIFLDASFFIFISLLLSPLLRRFLQTPGPGATAGALRLPGTTESLYTLRAHFFFFFFLVFFLLVLVLSFFLYLSSGYFPHSYSQAHRSRRKRVCCSLSSTTKSVQVILGGKVLVRPLFCAWPASLWSLPEQSKSGILAIYIYTNARTYTRQRFDAPTWPNCKKPVSSLCFSFFAAETTVFALGRPRVRALSPSLYLSPSTGRHLGTPRESPSKR